MPTTGPAPRCSGGVLEIRGNAGAQLGGAYAGQRRGMTGGVVLVQGSAGAHAGERMRRGLIAVGGRRRRPTPARAWSRARWSCAGALGRGAGASA